MSHASHQRRRRNLETARTRPSREELASFKDVADFSFTAGLKLLLTLGGLLAFCYIFFFVHVFPSGISAGDSLLFLFLALGFALIHLVVIGFCALSMRWVVRLMEWFRDRKATGQKMPAAARAVTNQKAFHKRLVDLVGRLFGFFDSVFIGFMSVISFILLLDMGLRVDGYIATALAVSGFLVAVIFSRFQEHRTKERLTLVLILSVAAFIPFVLAYKFFEKELGSVLERLGIRHTNVIVALSKENADRLHARTRESKEPIYSCEEQEAGEPTVVVNVDLPWHGPGERSLMKLPVKSNTPRQASGDEGLIELDHSGVHLQGKAKQDQTRCLPDTEKAYFASGSAVLSQHEQGRLAQNIQAFLNAGLRPANVRVIGRADLQAHATGGDANIDLSAKRAAAVESFLVSTFKVDPKIITTEAMAAVQWKAPCLQARSALASECMGADRHAEIVLMFAAKDAAPAPSGPR